MLIQTPFGPPVPEVRLSASPLILVVAQLRFPRIVAIETAGFIAGFQEALRADYPILRPERQVELHIGPSGAVPQQNGIVWKFSQQNGPWEIALTSDFVALSTPRYTSRTDFLGRLRQLIDALHRHVAPRVYDRFGVRYVDRVASDGVAGRVCDLMRSEFAGASCVDLSEEESRPVAQIHAFSDSMYVLENNVRLHARWGLLPPGGSFDLAVAPADRTSWVLDLDMFIETPTELEPGALTEQARVFCEQIYRFFRWVVTDQFLREHGGQP